MEKWGRTSGMLEGGSVNLTPSMYVFNSLFEIHWPLLSAALFSFFYLLVFESTYVVFSSFFFDILYSILF